jgi:hypothetical protein
MARTTSINRPPFLTAPLAAARRLVRWAWRAAVRLALLIALLALLGKGESRDTSLRAQVTALARPHLFDYVGWEIDALWAKAQEELLGTGPYLDGDAARAQVMDYFALLDQARQIEARIEAIYTDPAIDDPPAAAAALSAERDDLRARLANRQPLVESILENQVSAVLVDEGFGLWGQVLPPVSMHVTPVPTLLVVSPRDRIAFAVDLNLDALPVNEREQLEARVDRELGVSSLVVPLGGLSMYPSMVVETPSIARAVEVTAHEWAHHYLFFFPLGWEYARLAETRILNETAATFFGREIALKVMARYYPEIPLPVYPSFRAPLAPPPAGESPPRDPDAPGPFDFAQELNLTRVQVDFLLSQGMVEAAETVMEYRRRAFVRHGYAIRKLNQAYFAFYGGYQGEPGAGGADPIGPGLEELRALSPDLHAWMNAIRGMTTRADLLAALDEARGRQ